LNTSSIEAIPDTSELKKHIKNATGYGAGGLHHENWERALVQTVQSTMKEMTNPGINVLIKHVGSIIRSLISLAFVDVKAGGESSATFRLIPEQAENFLLKEFEDMLWELMKVAANKAIISLEPMYTTIDPTIPTFPSDADDEIQEFYDRAEEDPNMAYGFMQKMKNFSLFSPSKVKSKDDLFERCGTAALEKKSFLPDVRSSMMTDDEAEAVIAYSHKYISALMEFQKPMFKFQVNHNLIKGFKDMLGGPFITTLIDKTDWKTLIRIDETEQNKLTMVEDNIKALNESMKYVQKLQRGY
jgi:hypothetical protein